MTRKCRICGQPITNEMFQKAGPYCQKHLPESTEPEPDSGVYLEDSFD